MISVLLLAFDATGGAAAAPGDAVRTLAALVPATVEGVVRDVCLAGPDGAALAKIADYAGCSRAVGPDVTRALRAGAAILRSPQVLVMRAGAVIQRPVVEEVATLLPTLDTDHRATYLLRADRRDLIGRLFPALAPAAALLCPRAWLLTAEATSLANLAGRAPHRRVFRTAAWLDA
jgi:hypothetical protein